MGGCTIEDATRAARRTSAGLFGNEKVAEVVCALHVTRSPVTAQELAVLTRISHSMVRDVLVRLTAVGILTALPKVGGTRSAQYYLPVEEAGWELLSALAEWVLASSGAQRPDRAHVAARVERGRP